MKISEQKNNLIMKNNTHTFRPELFMTERGEFKDIVIYAVTYCDYKVNQIINKKDDSPEVAIETVKNLSIYIINKILFKIKDVSIPVSNKVDHLLNGFRLNETGTRHPSLENIAGTYFESQKHLNTKVKYLND